MIGDRAAPEAPPAGVPRCSYCKGAGEHRQRLIATVYRICHACKGRGWVEPTPLAQEPALPPQADAVKALDRGEK